jgi:putative ABC transport system permease protein
MIVTTAPWRRAPGLVFRAPAVVLAVFLAAAVLALAAASGPLFVSSTGSAALAREVASRCPEDPLPSFTYPAGDAAYGDAGTLRDRAGVDAAPTAAALTGAGLPAPYRVVIGQPTTPTRLGELSVTLFARDGAEGHVRVLSRVPGPGLLMSDLTAERLGLRVGDRLSFHGRSAPVVGLYEDLNGRGFGAGVPRWWCSWSGLIISTLERRPPPLLLTDEATVLRLTNAGTKPGRDYAQVSWYAPTAPATLADAAAVVAAQARSVDALAGLDTVLWDESTHGGDLAGALDKARREQAGVAGPVWPTALTGTLVALLLVAGAGGYWAERRRREITLLAARGAGAVALAVKAVLEMALPALAGAAAGWFAARWLVGAVGPAARTERGAATRAAVAVGAALVVGLVLLGVAAVARQRRAERRRDRRPARVPWELALIGAALWAYARIRSGAGVGTDRGVVTVSPVLIAYPLLALAAALALLGRLAGRLAPLARRRTAGLGVAGFLASRRLVAGGLVTLALGALVAAPAGLLVFGAALARSMQQSVAAKALVYTGAERAVVTHAPPAAAVPTGGHGTVVSVASGRLADGTEVGVLGIEPDFARFAYADRGVLGYDLAGLVGRLRGSDAVLVGCGGCDVRAVLLKASTVPVRVVGRPRVFPGLRPLKEPTLVLPRPALSTVDHYADRREEVWTTDAELPALGQALAAAGVATDAEKTPDTFLDVTDLLPLTWTVGYLQALAALTGLVGVAGLLLHLGARQRAATVAYPMLRRMGLRRRRHLAALATEITALLALAVAAGAAGGFGAAAAVRPWLDLNPAFAPPPLLRLPVPALLGLAAAAAGLVVVASLATQRAADRIQPADALRAG